MAFGLGQIDVEACDSALGHTAVKAHLNPSMAMVGAVCSDLSPLQTEFDWKINTLVYVFMTYLEHKWFIKIGFSVRHEG
jgi:hypothetical protein